MSSPSLTVQLAFGYEPLTANAAVTWTDVSAQVAASEGFRHHIQRGRNHERDEFEAGTAIVVLRNTDRRFDPDLTTGPHYPHIRPMTKIRIGALWASTVYWLFYGYVESWTPEYLGGSVSTCTLECVDAFKFFGMIEIHTSGNRPQEYSNLRIDAALNATLWPAADRATSTSGDVIVAEIPIDDSALAVMQQTTAAEGGQFYVDRQGNAVFEPQSYRAGLTTPVALWDSGGPGSGFFDLTTRFDDSTIWNQVYASAIGGIQQASYHTTSRDTYGVRTLRLGALPWIDDTEAFAAAQLMISRYAEPHTRVERLAFDPGVRDTWADVLPREISDLITVRRTTLADGETLDVDVLIEAIEWQISKGLWICTLQLSPVFTLATPEGSLNTTDDWLVPALQNGWVDYLAGRSPVGYRKEGDWVYLRGAVKDGSPANARITTLPVGYRPAASYVSGIDSNGAYGQLLIQTDGDVFQTVGTNIAVSLDRIQFRVI